MRVVIRRGGRGYIVTAYHDVSSSHPLFVQRVTVASRSAAERCRDRFRAGEPITAKDMAILDPEVMR